jgi:hypothetical protein
MPINNRLLALAETKDINESEAKVAMGQFEEWNKRQLVRVATGGLAWILGATAIVLL